MGYSSKMEQTWDQDGTYGSPEKIKDRWPGEGTTWNLDHDDSSVTINSTEKRWDLNVAGGRTSNFAYPANSFSTGVGIPLRFDKGFPNPKRRKAAVFARWNLGMHLWSDYARFKISVWPEGKKALLPDLPVSPLRLR